MAYIPFTFRCSGGREALWATLLLFSSSVARAAQERPPATRVSARLLVVNLADTVERVLGGVVNIRTLDRPNSAQEQAHLNQQFGNLLIPKADPDDEASRSLGSGFFFHSRNHVVTNYHVVRDAKRISIVSSSSSPSLSAKILGFDEKADIAVLLCEESEPGPTLVFGPTESLRLGEPVFAIGNPFGYGHTVTSGILSARGRVIGAGPYNDFLQTDAAINPGNSGGPLFNARGEVVGINTATASAAQGISFAIPSEIAEPVVRSLINSGKASRLWIGVFASNISERSGDVRNNYGVLVNKVANASPAMRAGVQAGDAILAFDSMPVKNLRDLERGLRAAAERKNADLTLYRRGKGSVKIKVPIEEKPDNLDEGF